MAANGEQPTIVINADARASHQSVVNILEAARIVNLYKITFLTQAPK
jgi:biopolymer transport protein ExbD